MSRNTKLLFTVAGFFLLLAAIISTFNLRDSLKPSITDGNFRSAGFQVPSGTGLPSGSLSSMFLPDSSDSAGSAGNTAEQKIASSQEAPVDSVSAENGTKVPTKIIKNGNLTFKVKSADDAAGKISAIADRMEGSVTAANITKNSNGTKSGTVTIKVPIEKFDEAISEIKKVAELVVNESISATDVTEQYMDLESRLRNKYAEEKAFADILNRSGQIDDVLKVTRELARVRGEIEGLEGQKKLLDSRTDMSTIVSNISEDEKITITDSWRPLQVAKDSVNALIEKSQKFVDFVIILVITVIPTMFLYLLPLLVIFLLIRKIMRLRNKTRIEPDTKIDQTEK